MMRIDANTVELTEREQYLCGAFERELDKGYSTPEAVKRVKDTTDAVESIGGMGHTDPAFWEYLGQ
jgi:hypothetical protein